MFAPTDYSGEFAVPQNRFALCGFYVVLWDGKSGAEFFYSDTALILLLVCFSSIAFLHRFCRHAPIEALPQAPLGALPPDPHNGFHPLTLTRGVPLDLLLASLGVGAQLWSALPIPHSSLLIPHSSFLTPHFLHLYLNLTSV